MVATIRPVSPGQNPPKGKRVAWTHIDHASSRPATPKGDSADHVPTRVLAEFYKSEADYSIVYNGALGDKGFSIVLYHRADPELTWCALLQTKPPDFRFEQTDAPEWIDEDGATATMAFVGVGSPPCSAEDPP